VPLGPQAPGASPRPAPVDPEQQKAQQELDAARRSGLLIKTASNSPLKPASPGARTEPDTVDAVTPSDRDTVSRSSPRNSRNTAAVGRGRDILRLTWAQYDVSTIMLRQSQTGVVMPVPVAAPLKAAFDECLGRLREHEAEVAEKLGTNVVTLPKATPAKHPSGGGASSVA
jgi:hypothetical protein